jgi:hypothetical protein
MECFLVIGLLGKRGAGETRASLGAGEDVQCVGR